MRINYLILFKSMGKTMKRKNILYVCFVSIFFLAMNCGQIMKGEKSNVENLLNKAKKNITTAESLADLKNKSDLLKTAESQLNEADALNQKEKTMENEIAAVYAYLYFVSGDYNQAKKLASKNTNHNDPFVAVLNIRISIKEKGKEYSKNAINILEPLLAGSPNNAMARLTLGDSHFLIGNFQEAQKDYTEVLKTGEAFQVQAADRLEVLDQIRRTGIDTEKVQNIIFSSSVRRDEIADLLQRVYNADKYMKFGKSTEKNFKDITSSIYSNSIQILREKGFFSYISGENFEPYKIVTRGEIAKMIEDFFVIKSGNSALRSKFLKDAKSSIRGLDTKDQYYNAIKTAIEAKAISISLDGSINPLEPMSGLETIDTFSKIIK
jgi:tetratricopeptide (TPR) repeat protein